MQSGYLEPPIRMGKKDFLIVLPFGENLPLDSFYQAYGSSFWTCKIWKFRSHRACQNYVCGRNSRRGCFLANEHTAPLEVRRRLRAAVGLLLSCRALSGKSRWERLFGQDLSIKADRLAGLYLCSSVKGLKA
ncbi:hypothetical protein ACFX2H_009715 [Malus domestica]